MRKDDRGGSFKKDFKSGKDRTYNNKKDFAKRDSYVEKNDTNADTEEKAVSNETENTGLAEGRNAVMEAIRSGRTVEKVFIQEGLSDGTILSIVREIKKRNILHSFVSRDRLDQMSESGRHQGVIAQCAEYSYSEIEDIFEKAKEKGEDPFIIILDEIEDPHNLGAIIRTANLCGAHGVIIPKHRAAGLTSTAVRASAGAINYTPVVKVTNISKTIEELKERGVWFACADMQGEVMYRCNLKGPIGLVIGNEGNGVSRLVKEKCDYIVSIPMKGDIDSLNASVAAGVLCFEVVRQRMG
ncbi:23S rRNA (guanosine(2251)-2'-O)-methyltransferase RlmB [Eubacterium ruminantium]|uniref:23S rRNA (guanosine(2251)-2'-O)-methyltransferase RlmB n=1 Tax=Eubacterium ruminantium TaxID=42322 RepID=UPI00156A2C59|nr:23S rRNA (guanosine(2251)-2'-O)-methyltransferase RlmB [Eubacterium ruminantium]